jgi:membrane protein YqaA with SNARE-associated domain
MTRELETNAAAELVTRPAPGADAADAADLAAEAQGDTAAKSPVQEPDAVHSYLIRNLIYTVIAIVVLVGLAYLAQRYLGYHLEVASRWLTHTTGYFGVFLSIWLIDTFTLPITPDVILAFVAHKGSALHAPTALAVICVASIVAGNTGYYLAKRISHWGWMRRRLARSFNRGHALFERFGVWTVVIAGLTPIPFSIVCWFAGLYEMKPGPLFLATLSRIPRFVVWFFLLRLGFTL